jgi:hypothetical protein
MGCRWSEVQILSPRPNNQQVAAVKSWKILGVFQRVGKFLTATVSD